MLDNKIFSIFSSKMSLKLLCSIILYALSLFSISNKSFSLFNCLLMLEGAIPSIGNFRFFLSLITRLHISSLVKFFCCLFALIKTFKMSTITSLESPGCNNPIDKQSFLISSLSLKFVGLSYLLNVISMSGISFDMVFCFTID